MNLATRTSRHRRVQQGVAALSQTGRRRGMAERSRPANARHAVASLVAPSSASHSANRSPARSAQQWRSTYPRRWCFATLAAKLTVTGLVDGDARKEPTSEAAPVPAPASPRQSTDQGFSPSTAQQSLSRLRAARLFVTLMACSAQATVFVTHSAWLGFVPTRPCKLISAASMA